MAAEPVGRISGRGDLVRMMWIMGLTCLVVVLAIFFVAMVIDEWILRRDRDRHIRERYHKRRSRTLAANTAASEALNAKMNARWKVIKLP